MEKIDIVILWVDNNDKAWQKQMLSFCKDKNDSAINRYRDWGLLRYWFRSIEENAPWVNKIHFITYGHIPEWLNINNKKVNIVKHEDFIPKKYLPTFNSNAIELNLHRIKELSEKFILFNDDVFLINKTKKEDFFVQGLPKDVLIETPIIPEENIFYQTMYNNIAIINKHYDKKTTIKNIKYFSMKYGKYALSSWMESHHRGFTGFMNQHITTPFLKSSFEKLWAIEPEKCDKTSSSKFRSKDDITQYLIRYIQLLDGNYIPRKTSFGTSFEIHNNVNYKKILDRKEKVICINDSDVNINFEQEQKRLIKQFNDKFPRKSSYEID